MFRECKSDTRPICREKLSALVYGQKTCTPRYRHKQEISMGIAQWCRCQLHFLSPLPNADDSRAMLTVPRLGSVLGHYVHCSTAKHYPTATCFLSQGKALYQDNMFPVPGQSTIPGQHVSCPRAKHYPRATCFLSQGKALYQGNMFQGKAQGQYVRGSRAKHYTGATCFLFQGRALYKGKALFKGNMFTVLEQITIQRKYVLGTRVRTRGAESYEQRALRHALPVSYTHLTLPTNAEV